MAGADGFEPPHGRIKTSCLTAWRRPNTFSGRDYTFEPGAASASGAAFCHGVPDQLSITMRKLRSPFAIASLRGSDSVPTVWYSS